MPQLHVKLLISLVLAAVAGVACSTSPTGRSQVVLKNDQELAVEAARQFAEMKANMPLETDRTKIDYIHCVAQAVVLELPPEYRDLEWEMAIFQSESVNAFAMPGGKIGVMTGILKAAQNQDQLAAVIGHEIAHVTARHANERAARTHGPTSSLNKDTYSEVALQKKYTSSEISMSCVSNTYDTRILCFTQQRMFFALHWDFKESTYLLDVHAHLCCEWTRGYVSALVSAALPSK